MFDLTHLRSMVGLVGQEPVLFDTTVAENISLGKQGASREEVEMAAKDANAHGFVSTMPDGYGTSVGKHEINLVLAYQSHESTPCMHKLRLFTCSDQKSAQLVLHVYIV